MGRTTERKDYDLDVRMSLSEKDHDRHDDKFNLLFKKFDRLTQSLWLATAALVAVAVTFGLGNL